MADNKKQIEDFDAAAGLSDTDVFLVQQSGTTRKSTVSTMKSDFAEKFVTLDTEQTIAGIKTFGSFPVTPSSAPTTDYQTANKKYVDDSNVTIAGEDYLSLTGQQITANAIDLDNLSATGTPSVSTYLRGDNTWATVSSGSITTDTLTNLTGILKGNGTDIDVAVAGVDYIAPSVRDIAVINLSTNQTANITSGNHIQWDTINNISGSGITISSGTGQALGFITLAANKSYEIDYYYRPLFSGATGVSGGGLYDSLGVLLIGQNYVSQLAISSTSNNSVMPSSKSIITVGSSALTFKVDIISATAITSIQASGTTIIIKEL